MNSGILPALIVAVSLAVSMHGRGAHGQADHLPRSIFVFGSSYADTGNVGNPDAARPYPWSKPYGETWPGSPSGRYSNGQVLTDLLASALNLTVPTSFARWSSAQSADAVKGGINFATGGSGVLSAYGFPSITSQIDEFEKIASSYTQEILGSAIVLYATAGDDYFYALTVQNTPLTDIYPLTVSVGKQVINDLIRLYQLGLRKFAVTYLPPTGCLPVATSLNAFRQCNDTWSFNVAQSHNARIYKNVVGLRQYFSNGSIALVDLYSAFTIAQSKMGTLRPCCLGNAPSPKCSKLGPQGRPAYTLCSNPSSKFYWDDLMHPTRAAWQSVFKLVLPSLRPLM